jgi:hypothetical protein
MQSHLDAHRPNTNDAQPPQQDLKFQWQCACIRINVIVYISYQATIKLNRADLDRNVLRKFTRSNADNVNPTS